VPEEYRDLLREATLVCTPLSARGRWLGVILSDRGPAAPLRDDERYLLWTLGKTPRSPRSPALADRQPGAGAPAAGADRPRARRARERHPAAVRGAARVLQPGRLSPQARERIAAELQAALFDLRRALQRPLGRVAPETHTTLLQEVDRLRREHRDLAIRLTPGSERVELPRQLEPLARRCSPRPCATRTSTRARRAWR
jgi:hypothetical protein